MNIKSMPLGWKIMAILSILPPGTYSILSLLRLRFDDFFASLFILFLVIYILLFWKIDIEKEMENAKSRKGNHHESPL